MKNIIHLLIVLLFSSVLFWGCTKDMEDMNTDPKSISNVPLFQDGILFSVHIQNMEKNLFGTTTSWEYQVEQNLNADVFSGFTMQDGFSGTTNDNYSFNQGWNSWAFIMAQSNFNDFLALKTLTNSGKTEGDFYAYALILKVMTALPVVDDFGPFPYLQYGTTVYPVFNNVDSIYKYGFMVDLANARDTLEAYAKGPSAARVQNSGADISSFGGNITSWIKLANTLQLRLAMRMSTVDPADAKTYVTAAVSDPNGFIDVTTGDWSINCAAGNPNGLLQPFSFISTAWDNCAMSADMVSYLEGLQDPRLSVYFLPSTDVTDGVSGKYEGIRAGSVPTGAAYGSFSMINVPTNFMFISGAESYFLLAEAALDGFTNGNASALYTSGVEASFTLRGLTAAQASTYLASTGTPANYVDPHNSANNNTATSKVTPAISGSVNEEQIITQKWLAIWPQGAEGWAEFRRTGFPKLMLPINMVSAPNTDGTIPAGHFAKRMPYPSNILSLNPAQATAATNAYLGGKDNGYSKIWWEPAGIN